MSLAVTINGKLPTHDLNKVMGSCLNIVLLYKG